MHHKINWVRVFLILGLTSAFLLVQLMATFYSLSGTSAVSLMAMKGYIESLIGILFFVVVAYKTKVADIRDILRDTKLYIVSAFLFLCAGVAIGVFLQDTLQGLLTPVFEELERMSADIQEIPLYSQVLVIFGNNARAATLSGVLALFPFFGIFMPMATMFLNGGIVGAAPAIFGMSWSHFVIAIFPHGILEVPALVLASGVGFRVAVATLKACVGAVFPPPGVDGRDMFLRELGPGWRSLKLFSVIILLLVAAAVVEALVTPMVMSAAGIIP